MILINDGKHKKVFNIYEAYVLKHGQFVGSKWKLNYWGRITCISHIDIKTFLKSEGILFSITVTYEYIQHFLLKAVF